MELLSLPENTLIGNPILYPIKNEDSYSLQFCRTKPPYWFAVVPSETLCSINLKFSRDLENPNLGIKFPNPYSLFKGGLFYQEPDFEFNFLFLRIRVGGDIKPVSVDDLVKKELLKETTYKEYFSSQKFNLSQKIPVNNLLTKVYLVTSKGDEAVFLEADKEHDKLAPNYGFQPANIFL